MANLFLNLPVPPGDGAGAAVDTSAMGKVRTITVQGQFTATLTIEISNDGGTDFAPLVSFSSPGKRTVSIAAQFMRVSLLNVVAATPLAVNVDVASNDDGGRFLNLLVPPGDGVGAAVDVSSLGTFNTAIVSGNFSGQVIIEISEDGADWAQCFVFTSGDRQSKQVVAQFMRVRRNGTIAGIVGTAEVDIGAINDSGGSGSASASNCLVFQPGGTQSGPVIFSSWVQLVARLTQLRNNSNGGGCYLILFDDSITSPAVIPAGSYDMDCVIWGAVYRSTLVGVDVELPEGVILTNLRRFEGTEGRLRVTSTASATPPIADVVGFDEFVVQDGVTLRRSGAVPMIEAT
ncbi:MAG: hypothetical protein ACE5LB_18475, partial [Acidiferrobacterales bacterium]